MFSLKIKGTKKFSISAFSLSLVLLVYFYLCFVSMSRSTTFVMSPEAEILIFKQRGGKSLKDAWYRINDAQNKSTNKQASTVLLRNFYMGVTNWYRYILDTLMGEIFFIAPSSLSM